MVIVIDGAGVRVDAPDDFSRFHIAAAPGVDVGAELHRANFGYSADQGHAMVSTDAIRAAVAGQVPAGWADGFDGMLAYAAQKGWLDDEGRFIQAHVDRTPIEGR